MYDGPLQDLIDALAQLPGIGPKGAQRIAFHVLDAPDEEVGALADALREVKEKARFCDICFNVSSDEECQYCRDPRRDQTVICVVEESKDVVAVERVFERGNVSTVMNTAHASGVLMLSAARRDIPVHLYTPSEVKKAVSGNGRADKQQMTAMITRILGLTEPPRPADAADALALAVCHCWRAPMNARLKGTL